jgi:argininosuccinate synthase
MDSNASYVAKPGEVKKVVLLYSGGLDTSVMIKYISENYKAEVIALTIDMGQPIEDLNAIKEKALKIGATKALTIDAKDEFADEYVAKAIKANALYQGKYPLGTAIGRPLLAKIAVEIAEKENADAIAHGCSGKGNDQVRIDSAVISLNPKMKIVAPVREWNMTRDKEIEYAKEKGISVPANLESPYSTDENLWGKSTECGVLEDPDAEPPKDVFNFVTIPEEASDKPEYITLEFKKGIPLKLNEKNLKLSELIKELNYIAAKHGIGIIDMVEDRIIGLKSREIYEYPAATCIIEAHKELEKFTCTIHENMLKPDLDNKWSYLAYAGLWYDPLMLDLDAFNEKINEKVSGSIRMKLYKGNATIVGRKSENALYDKNLATYNVGQTFNQKASPGFIEIWGLQTKLANQIIKK